MTETRREIQGPGGVTLVQVTTERGRCYLLRTLDGDQVELMGVTTALEVIPAPWLCDWYAREERKATEAAVWWAVKANPDLTQAELSGVVSTRLGDAPAAVAVRDAAADLGTEAHMAIEEHTLALMEDNPLKWVNGEDLSTGARIAFDSWLVWVDTRRPVFEAAEMTVWSMDLGLAGTLDSLIELDGKVTLVDYKTGRYAGGLKDRLQQAAYSLAAFDSYGLEVDAALILDLPKDKQRPAREIWLEGDVLEALRSEVPGIARLASFVRSQNGVA
jgi:hypothetical protein